MGRLLGSPQTFQGMLSLEAGCPAQPCCPWPAQSATQLWPKVHQEAGVCGGMPPLEYSSRGGPIGVPPPAELWDLIFQRGGSLRENHFSAATQMREGSLARTESDYII